MKKNNYPIDWTSPMVTEKSDSKMYQVDVFSKLMKEQNIIFIGDSIDDELCSVIQAQLLYLSAKDPKALITIYINSPGGSVFAGLGIWDTLHFIPNPIKTVNIGYCASMAAVLLLAGDSDKRYALKHSRTMIHQPMGGIEGQAVDIMITAKLVEILRDELEEIIIESTNLTKDNVKSYTDRDYWMTAIEAQKLGFISNIL